MSITLITGSMFSGKSSELFRRLNRAKRAGQKTILYKYALDNRYDEDTNIASSHDQLKMPAVPVLRFTEQRFPRNIDVIGIDEGQFIEGIERFSQEAANAGIHVIIAALDSNYKMEAFPRTTALMPISERIIKFRAVCFNCGQDAAFTKKIDTSNDAVEDIGGADKYVASCRKCFNSAS